MSRKKKKKKILRRKPQKKTASVILAGALLILYSSQLLAWLSLFLKASRHAMHIIKCQSQCSHHESDVEKKTVAADFVEQPVNWRQVVVHVPSA